MDEETTVLRCLLREARAYVQEDRDTLLEGHCLLDPDTFQPRRETLDEQVRPLIEKADGLLAEIDTALAQPSA